MKAITIWQPYASLFTIDEKHYETRAWNTKYRGPIAIHAAMQDPKRLLGKEDYAELERFALHHPVLGDWGTLPRGAIVAIAELVDVWQIKSAGKFAPGPVLTSLRGHVVRDLSEKELAFGNYDPGRYAWEFANVKKLEPPIPCKGQQGFWNWSDAGFLSRMPLSCETAHFE